MMSLTRLANALLTRAHADEIGQAKLESASAVESFSSIEQSRMSNATRAVPDERERASIPNVSSPRHHVGAITAARAHIVAIVSHRPSRSNVTTTTTKTTTSTTRWRRGSAKTVSRRHHHPLGNPWINPHVAVVKVGSRRPRARTVARHAPPRASPARADPAP